MRKMGRNKKMRVLCKWAEQGCYSSFEESKKGLAKLKDHESVEHVACVWCGIMLKKGIRIYGHEKKCAKNPGIVRRFPQARTVEQFQADQREGKV